MIFTFKIKTGPVPANFISDLFKLLSNPSSPGALACIDSSTVSVYGEQRPDEFSLVSGSLYMRCGRASFKMMAYGTYVALRQVVNLDWSTKTGGFETTAWESNNSSAADATLFDGAHSTNIGLATYTFFADSRGVGLSAGGDPAVSALGSSYANPIAAFVLDPNPDSIHDGLTSAAALGFNGAATLSDRRYTPGGLTTSSEVGLDLSIPSATGQSVGVGSDTYHNLGLLVGILPGGYTVNSDNCFVVLPRGNRHGQTLVINDTQYVIVHAGRFGSTSFASWGSPKLQSLCLARRVL